MSHDVLFEERHATGVITLNRPQSLNALTYDMIRALERQLLVWKDDKNIHMVIVRSSSSKAFCAGGDIRWLYESGQGNQHEQMQFFWHEYRLNHLIHHYPKPYVALLDGTTMGGGVGISLHGGICVATDRFSFAMPETSIGFFPDIGASYLLSRLPQKLGFYLGLTGMRLDACLSKKSGLVDYLVSYESLAEFEKTWLSSDSKPLTETILKAWLTDVSMAPDSEKSLPLDDIAHCFSPKKLETILDYLDALDSDWAKETLKVLLTKSPRSLKITLKQLQEAEQLSFADCLRLDYCLVHHFMADPDFYEGVRAMIIDKDRIPKWQEADVISVGQHIVDRYFNEDCERLTFLV